MCPRFARTQFVLYSYLGIFQQPFDLQGIRRILLYQTMNMLSCQTMKILSSKTMKISSCQIMKISSYESTVSDKRQACQHPRSWIDVSAVYHDLSQSHDLGTMAYDPSCRRYPCWHWICTDNVHSEDEPVLSGSRYGATIAMQTYQSGDLDSAPACIRRLVYSLACRAQGCPRLVFVGSP